LAKILIVHYSSANTAWCWRVALGLYRSVVAWGSGMMAIEAKNAAETAPICMLYSSITHPPLPETSVPAVLQQLQPSWSLAPAFSVPGYIKLLFLASLFLPPSEDLMNGASASSNLRAAFSHCVQQVRSYDYHHYLCLLELPSSMRKAAFALRALNVETSRAIDIASDPRIGLMRLVWWQEAIDKMFANKLIEHPTAQALSSVIAETKLSKIWLKRSVEARINDARREVTDMLETIEELEKYAEDTVSTMLYLTLQAGGIKSTAADHAASHIGKASGILLLLKSLPYHATRNGHFSYIPTAIASKHGLIVKQGGGAQRWVDSREDLYDAVYEMASVANAHLEKARKLAASVPAEALPVLLPAVPSQVLLDSLRKVQFDVFDSRLTRGVLGIPPLWYQLKLKWTSWRRKY
ncbi:unnamed protein product, partial [Sphenostylis stenocarpa]